jgi:hypothetical protein
MFPKRLNTSPCCNITTSVGIAQTVPPPVKISLTVDKHNIILYARGETHGVLTSHHTASGAYIIAQQLAALASGSICTCGAN